MSNIVIIGSGPAGVSAALYTARAGVDTTVLTRGPGALDRAELIQNYYGFAAPISGAELERQGIEGAKAVGVKFVTTEAVGLTYTDKLTVETLDGDYPADAVILATGASRATPRIPGLAGLEGHGVSYCATCDAFAVRGRKAIVIGYDKEAEAEADFLSQMAQSVTYIPMYKDEPSVSEKVTVLREMPVEILGAEMDGMTMVSALKTRTAEHQTDMVFVLRDTISPTHLIPGLQMDGNHVAVNLQMETNLPGCFACGDLAGKPYQYIKSAGQGNVAALAAVGYLSSLNADKHSPASSVWSTKRRVRRDASVSGS